MQLDPWEVGQKVGEILATLKSVEEHSQETRSAVSDLSSRVARMEERHESERPPAHRQPPPLPPIVSQAVNVALTGVFIASILLVLFWVGGLEPSSVLAALSQR